jgi:hypothetical protein
LANNKFAVAQGKLLLEIKSLLILKRGHMITCLLAEMDKAPLTAVKLRAPTKIQPPSSLAF